ncbi:hypothetical protein ABPG77_001065 [Micractinium sp. CCAP 211/92]
MLRFYDAWAAFTQALQANCIRPTALETALSEAWGLGVAQFRVLPAVALVALAGAVWRLGRTGPQGTHVLSILLGFLVLYYPFGNAVAILVPAALGSYALLGLGRQRCVAPTWLACGGYLILWHAIMKYDAAWHEGGLSYAILPLMFATCKLIAAAHSYADGAFVDAKGQLSEYQREHALEERPSLLEYLGYLLGAGSLLVGPLVEMRPYLAFAHCRGVWAQEPPLPWRTLAARLLQSCLCFYLCWLLADRYKPDKIWKKDGAYQQLGFFARLAFLHISCTVFRLQLYVHWGLAEAGALLSGIGYSGPDSRGGHSWERGRCVRVAEVELGPSLADATAHWNLPIAIFLRHYVYDRLPHGSGPEKLGALAATFLASVLWHGLQVGFLLAGTGVGVAVLASRVLYKWQQACGPRPALQLGWQVVQFCFKWLVVDTLLLPSFQALKWDKIWRMGGSTYAAGWAATLLILLASWTLFPVKGRRSKERENGAQGV